MAEKTRERRSSEVSSVYKWRVGQLRRCGFTKRAAEYHADTPLDLNDARNLASKGCPWRLIIEILGEHDCADAA